MFKYIKISHSKLLTWMCAVFLCLALTQTSLATNSTDYNTNMLGGENYIEQSMDRFSEFNKNDLAEYVIDQKWQLLAASKKSSYSSRYSAYRYGRGFPRHLPATGRNVFVFDPRALYFGMYNRHGKLVDHGRAVGGANYCRDVGRACRTPRGVFVVHSKRGAACRSTRYPRPHGGAKMPYCNFFKGGYAIHGSYQLPRYNASHGCIRISPKQASWLSRTYLTIGSVVVVRNY